MRASIRTGLPSNLTPTLTQRAISVLRRFGTDAHIWLPGVGVVNGLTAGNFSDTAGTTASIIDSTAGVGLVIDATNTLGAELNPDVEFTTGTGWSVVQPTSGSVGISGGRLTINSLDGTRGAYVFTPSVVVGRAYRYEIVVNSVTTGAISVQIGSVAGPSITSAGTYSGVIVATSTGNNEIKRATPGQATNAVIESFSLRELIGAIPASQGTTANKPILRRGAVNRLLWSQTFSDGLWGKTGITVASGVTAPDSTSTAFTITEDTSTGSHDLTQSRTINVGVPHTFSIHLKASGRNLARVMMTWNGVTDRVHADFDLSNGTVGSAVTTGTGVSTASPTITNLGNGWYRCTISGSCATGSTLLVYARAMQSAGVVSYTGSGASAYQVWGAELETGSTASAYVPTTTAAASSPTGSQYWELDGTDFLTLSAVPFQQADDHCVVLAGVANAYADQVLFSIRNTAATGGIVSQLRVNTSGLVQALWRDDASAITRGPSALGVVGFGAAFVGSCRKVGTSYVVRRNGGNQASESGAPGTTTVNLAAIGASVTTTTTNQFNGTIGPVIAIKGTVSDADLLTLERWVGSLSGVTIT